VAGTERFDVAIVGSGFSGSLLARILARNGWRVLLVDRARHPRFALGESTTPLANLALERIGRDHGLPELGRLATYGRWLAAYPAVRRGLKRGFSFYLQQPGIEWRPGPERRLLVAASPADRVADTHWLRADVDALFARLAVEDGVELREGTVVEAVAGGGEGSRLALAGEEGAYAIAAPLVVDASGPAGVVARRLGAAPGRRLETSSALVFGHFRGVGELAGALRPGDSLTDAPYPEDRAAVHHLLEEGWMYLLAFDHGVTSAGLLLEPGAARSSGAAPAALWSGVVGRYPTLARLFETAEVERPIGYVPRLQHRLTRAWGPGWVAMPHTYGFVDPLFSVGIAWSLRAVERLAEILVESGPGRPAVASGEAFARYGGLLAAEIEQIDRLVATAYRARRRFGYFTAHSLLYFAWVSFAESFERLGRPERPWWRGFLGTGEARVEALVAESARRIAAAGDRAEESDDYRRWVVESIEPFDVAGLGAPERRNLYPVDLADLERSAGKLGLDAARLEAGLARLRAELQGP
jgi:FADH2 O2-dependent halogenase